MAPRKTSVAAAPSLLLTDDISDISNTIIINLSFSNLSDLRRKKIKNIIIGHLNVNSIRNKIEDIRLIFQDNIDVIALSETKLDETFTTAQFNIKDSELLLGKIKMLEAVVCLYMLMKISHLNFYLNI